MNEVDRNYKWFKANLKELLKKYKGQYIVIANQEVIFASKEEQKAITYASELEMGTFIIQKCEKEDQNSIQVFHTRAIF
ncbi:putative uncharacterized protein [Mycoplasma sp. CAG:776]|nr:putative uncharacterized protein [Mycoplasma sp. CAG:776]